MKLEYIRYFNHLAKVLSYTKAAQELYITQPTLSMAIRQIEKELDLQLFKRAAGSSRVELTPAGAVLHEYCDLALNNFDTGLRLAHETQGQINSELRVGTIYAMQGYFWSQAMQAFTEQQANPPKITIEQAYSVDLISRLRKGELDVAFAAKTDSWEDLSYVPVWSQPLVLCVNKNNALAKYTSVSLDVLADKLADQDFLTYSTSSPTLRSIREGLSGAELNLVSEYDDEITMSALVVSETSKMALFCYSFLVNAFENVVCLPVRGVPYDFHKVYLVSRKESHPKIVENFIQYMSSYRFPNAAEATPNS